MSNADDNDIIAGVVEDVVCCFFFFPQQWWRRFLTAAICKLVSPCSYIVAAALLRLADLSSMVALIAVV